mmetsp:Transcript_18271/g.38164  ORF Transcript_18271/g.38164 Transcript_18271/m.38164 type:complete len:160 (+) Transcript_18271:2470-2949(+)
MKELAFFGVHLFTGERHLNRVGTCRTVRREQCGDVLVGVNLNRFRRCYGHGGVMALGGDGNHSTRLLTEANVEEVLREATDELGTLFGTSEENRAVGITGSVELVSLDGPTVVLRLVGRFWHRRSDVLARVAQYLQTRIPEIFEVTIEDPEQLDDTRQE